MARAFDGSTSNYLSRTVDFSLNGATECSFAAWVKAGTAHATLYPYVMAKAKNAWTAVAITYVINTRIVNFSVENETLTQTPNWETSADIADNIWTRLLFTWKRNAIDATDGIIYVNGVPVSATYTANGYTGSFTIEDQSDAYEIGRRPLNPEWATSLTGSIAWVCVWNRQLTAQEALIDYTNPRNVKNGLVSIVELAPDVDQGAIGGSMTVNGTLAPIVGPQIVSANPKIQNTIRPRPFAPGMAR